MNKPNVTVVGAGLAGAEAAYRLLSCGYPVTLYEMKPKKRTPAHKGDGFAELVCSNSLRSDRIVNAVGLLKEEMRTLGSLIMEAADATRVPAGGALAVDREGFSAYVTDKLKAFENLTVVSEELTELPASPAIVATGPLTSDALSAAIEERFGKSLHFYDAAAPIVSYDSLDHDKVFAASRYDRGADYLNCPMTREEYFAFYHALVNAETAELHSFETPRVFEGCMPVEVMAKRGELTLAYGPLKPVGLEVGGKRPFAVVQLRRDNADGTLYNIVGFQTNLKFSEQKRVFGLIPGLEHAEYARFGVMHRNTFLESPKLLNFDYSLRDDPLLFFAGQMTGVEGYVESAASGLLSSISLIEKLEGRTPVDFTSETAIGALGHYVAEYNGGDFQPMNVTFGIMDPLPMRVRSKQERCERIANRAADKIRALKETYGL
ncbi:MAG: methylenetetrahydrofolate--tRNA-(uracil(54)-C(5))-methyltransferase (FADH(2)-oxidizing) TrmFO [Clostridia bacterium]|nr:methylenetetrahydrofolate--tRNA-(uracil(54)-C(5))-methyltransferase (FADH(2)-oxidizing) TrmFO [Clostridia bacterium]